MPLNNFIKRFVWAANNIRQKSLKVCSIDCLFCVIFLVLTVSLTNWCGCGCSTRI